MPVFTNHLKKESELIRLGVELLDAYCEDLRQEKPVSTADMRMAVYAMQIAFETLHLAKEESILYPALTNSEKWFSLPSETQHTLVTNLRAHEKGRRILLELRLSIEEYEHNPTRASLVGWRLGDFVDHLSCYLENEEKQIFTIADQILDSSAQKSLFHRALQFEQAHGFERTRSPFLILSHLRKAKGMTAA